MHIETFFVNFFILKRTVFFFRRIVENTRHRRAIIFFSRSIQREHLIDGRPLVI